jgi:pimeloyl-ACP methyl ester carboxylesterase
MGHIRLPSLRRSMTVATRNAKMPAPRLITVRQPAQLVGVALVLHGGGGRGTIPVSPSQLSVLRMVPIAARIARAGRRRVAVLRLLNAVRGFGVDPLSNVRWALRETERRYPSLPVALVGHSLGGSVALAAAGNSSVTSVVALAPWLGGSESVQPLYGRSTLIVHGVNDRVTSCAAAHAYAIRARAAGARVSFVRVDRGEHTMLRRMPAFDVLAARYVHATLDPGHSDDRRSGFRSRLERLAVAARDTPGDFVV